MKKFIALLLSCVMLVGILAACGGSKQPSGSSSQPDTPPAGGYTQTYEWNVASTFGGNSMRNMDLVLNTIEERSNGRMKFNRYWSNALVSIAEVPDALKDGIADMAVIATVNYPSILTYNAEMVGMPFVGFESAYQVVACWDAMREAFPDELQGEWDKIGAIPYMTWTTPGYHILTVNEGDEIRTPADLAGHKLMAGKTQFLKLINANGGAGLQVAPTAYYENLEKAVADGVVQSVGTVRTFGALELIKSATLFTDEEVPSTGAYFDMFYFAISKKSWDKLDPEMQQIFEDVHKELDADNTECQRSLDDSANAYTDDAKFNGIKLSKEEIQVWADAMVPFNLEEIENMKSNYKKDKAGELYEWMLNWIKENPASNFGK